MFTRRGVCLVFPCCQSIRSAFNSLLNDSALSSSVPGTTVRAAAVARVYSIAHCAQPVCNNRHSLTPSLTPSLTQSRTHTPSLTHSFTHSITHTLACICFDCFGLQFKIHFKSRYNNSVSRSDAISELGQLLMDVAPQHKAGVPACCACVPCLHPCGHVFSLAPRHPPFASSHAASPCFFFFSSLSSYPLASPTTMKK